jgi:hypothetical protein
MEQRPGLGLRPLLLGLLASLVCWSVVASFVFAAQALADEPAPYVAPADRALQPELPELAGCPSAEVPIVAEEEAEAVTPELRELGHLRLEQQQACRAQTDRLDQVVERLWWVTSQTLALDRSDPALVEVNEWLQQGAERDDATQEDVHAVRNALTDVSAGTLRSVLVGPEDEKALPVLGEFEAAPAEADPELVASIDAAGEATKLALWFIAGIVVASVLGYGLYRVVDRNT